MSGQFRILAMFFTCASISIFFPTASQLQPSAPSDINRREGASFEECPGVATAANWWQAILDIGWNCNAPYFFLFPSHKSAVIEIVE